jgi:LacI family transcriptional regulator
VRRAVKKLDYRANAAARMLAGSEPSRVGFIYANPSHAYLSELLVGALQESTALGMQLTLGGAQEHTEQVRELESLLATGVSSFLLPPPMGNAPDVLDLLTKSAALWVAISPANPESHPLSVSADHFDSARRMTQRLVQLGHRQIGFITGDPASKGGADRYRGHLAALAEAGLEAPAPEQGYFTFESGLHATQRLLARSPECTAIIACNDDMAAAAISIAHRLGLHVPDDVTVVGFDDTPISTIVTPAITTARQPISDMARMAIRILDQAIKAKRQGHKHAPRHETFHCSLIERESSAPPRQKDKTPPVRRSVRATVPRGEARSRKPARV